MSVCSDSHFSNRHTPLELKGSWIPSSTFLVAAGIVVPTIYCWYMLRSCKEKPPKALTKCLENWWSKETCECWVEIDENSCFNVVVIPQWQAGMKRLLIKRKMSVDGRILYYSPHICSLWLASYPWTTRTQWIGCKMSQSSTKIQTIGKEQGPSIGSALGSTWNRWWQETNINAICNAGRARISLARRAIWMIIFLVGMFFTIQGVVHLFVGYLSYPIVTYSSIEGTEKVGFQRRGFESRLLIGQCR